MHEGKLAPGPDYFVYLTNEFVEDEAGFEALKDQARRVGPVKTFGGFLLTVPDRYRRGCLYKHRSVVRKLW